MVNLLGLTLSAPFSPACTSVLPTLVKVLLTRLSSWTNHSGCPRRSLCVWDLWGIEKLDTHFSPIAGHLLTGSIPDGLHKDKITEFSRTPIVRPPLDQETHCGILLVSGTIVNLDRAGNTSHLDALRKIADTFRQYGLSMFLRSPLCADKRNTAVRTCTQRIPIDLFVC